MTTTRRKFLSTAGAAGLASSWLTQSASGAEETDRQPKLAKLNEVLRQPVLKKELFKSPVIIKSVELLKWENSYLCRVRSADGAEGISVAHTDMRRLYPIFLQNLQPFFYRQGCAGTGFDSGESLRLWIQFSLQRDLPRAATCHN